MGKGIRIGLDIGIGSVGWAVISGDRKNALIEDFGVRLFDSGEFDKLGKDRKSQQRRGFRAVRRLVRRRHYRKERIKAHLENIKLTTVDAINKYFEASPENVYELRSRALKEKISPEEIAACIIHICNHRGYRDFYEEAVRLSAGKADDDEDQDESKDSEEAVNKQAMAAFDREFLNSGCSTVGEFICSARFTKEGDKFPVIRNRVTNEDRLLIRREYLRDELRKILEHQSAYYSCLNWNAIDMADKIVFSQRDFEDGPGNPDDKFRRYTGFLESLGNCMYYRDEKRGFRSTVIADIFAVTNTISQYRFVNRSTGELILPKEAAAELVDFLLASGNITMTNVKSILAGYGIELKKSENSDDKALSKAVKYLKTAKGCIEAAGLDWQEFISEPQLDTENFSRLHQLGEVISKYHTPARRRNELKKLEFASEKLIAAISGKKISGTANASYRYMCEAINAFLNGEIYGNFQAERLKALAEAAPQVDKRQLMLPVLDDEEVRNNPVVFRSINETRKVLNAIIRIYGSPEYINVEVASDLSRSFADRVEIQKQQKKNEKDNDAIRKKIAELLKIGEDEVKGIQLDKYKLYHEQEGKCLYSGNPLGDLEEILRDTSGRYEIDHIVPYSLVLDNTLHNKALVYGQENQAKRQRTPLMYLTGERKSEFIALANVMHSRKEHSISSRKYKYLMLESLYGPEAENILKDWKSRNINDTRYITKYIIGYIRENLIFSGDKKDPVFGIKGGLTSKFRKLWLNEKTWGKPEKDRDETHLHHAVDAVVIANLTREYVEIASDNIKLQQIFRRCRNINNPEYTEYLDACIKKMYKYYGFSEDYTRTLLTRTNRVPSYITNLQDEVDIRFNDYDEELFKRQIMSFYGDLFVFTVPPHMPLVSYKQELRFRGEIADSNPIRLREIDGVAKKIKRKPIDAIKSSELEKLSTGDTDLVMTLHRILDGRGAEYTVGQYMKDMGKTKFQTDKGQPVNKVSIVEGPVTNYYKKEINEHNHSYMGGMKYFCVEIYEDESGKTCTRGVRYVDIVRKDKKLRMKRESIPSNYKKHIMYMFADDYIEIRKKNGELKFNGYYKAVYNINANRFYYSENNTPLIPKTSFSISGTDSIIKINIEILGKKGGEIRCSAPLSLIPEKK